MSEEINSENIERITNYWIESSNDDYETMISLFETKHYHWTLFVGHLSLEKLLKGMYVNLHKKYPPFIHNLFRLAELNRLDVSDDVISKMLLHVTAFNLNVRYDDYKSRFYKKCTPEYTEKWIKNITYLRKWIQEKF